MNAKQDITEVRQDRPAQSWGRKSEQRHRLLHARHDNADQRVPNINQAPFIATTYRTYPLRTIHLSEARLPITL